MNFKKIVFCVVFISPLIVCGSGNPSKKRKIAVTQEEEFQDQDQHIYRIGDTINFYGNPRFEVLEEGPAQKNYVYVRDTRTGNTGLLHIYSKHFDSGYTYRTVDDLIAELQKGDVF